MPFEAGPQEPIAAQATLATHSHPVATIHRQPTPQEPGTRPPEHFTVVGIHFSERHAGQRHGDNTRRHRKCRGVGRAVEAQVVVMLNETTGCVERRHVQHTIHGNECPRLQTSLQTAQPFMPQHAA